MSTVCITLDEQRCIQCHACEIHCQVWQGAPADIHPARLCAVPPHAPKSPESPENPENREHGGRESGGLSMRSAFLHCFHCEDPHCVRVCPTTAMRRRSRDGIVYTVAGLCTGCMACAMACPWRLPLWSSSRERLFKCDLCRDRLDAGQLPACVCGCTTGALRLSRDPATLAAQRALREAALHDGGCPGPAHPSDSSNRANHIGTPGKGGNAW